MALQARKLCKGHGKVTHTAPDIDDAVAGADIGSEYRVWIMEKPA